MTTIEQAIAQACRVQRHNDRAAVTTPDGREHRRHDPTQAQQVAIVIYLGGHRSYTAHWSTDQDDAEREAQAQRRRGNPVALLPLDVTQQHTPAKP